MTDRRPNTIPTWSPGPSPPADTTVAERDTAPVETRPAPPLLSCPQCGRNSGLTLEGNAAAGDFARVQCGTCRFEWREVLSPNSFRRG